METWFLFLHTLRLFLLPKMELLREPSFNEDLGNLPALFVLGVEANWLKNQMTEG